jgi:hypothetical protein
MSENVLAKLESEVGKQPWYIWAGALTGGGVVFWYVIKNRAAKAAATQTPTVAPGTSASADLNGMTVSDMAGLPYATEGYTSDSGPVDNYPVSSGTSGGNLGTTATTGTTSTSQGALVRPRFNSNTTKAYDTKYAQGVPIHASPDSSSQVVGYAAYASQVQITGSPVGGSNNFGTGNTTGSGLWFPVSNGYISAYDLVGFFPLAQTAANMGSGGISEFQHFLNFGNRNTVDQHAELYNLGA